MFGLLRAAVLIAVLAERPVVAGYDVATAVTYVWLGQGLLSVVLLWGDSELARRIRTGDVVVDLGRPWDLQAALLATDLGRAGFAVLARLVPPVVFGAWAFPFRWPTRPSTGVPHPEADDHRDVGGGRRAGWVRSIGAWSPHASAAS